MDLKKIKQEFALSNRAFNICQYNSLLTSNDLILWSQRNGSFKHLRNCGLKTANEIDRIIEILIEKENTSHNYTTAEISLKQIILRFGLSHKSIKVCEKLNFLSSADILSFYIFKGTFHSINKLKKDICMELDNLCKALLRNKECNSHFQKLYRLEVDGLSLLKKNILQFTADQLISKLSVRAGNGLNYLCEGSRSWEDLIWIGIETEKLSELPKIGAKSSGELEGFFIELIQQFSHVYLESESNHSTLKQQQIQFKFPKLVLLKNDLMRIQNSNLNFIGFVVEYLPQLFQGIEFDFIENKSNKSIAKKNRLTAERVRQIRVKTNPKIDEKIKSLWLMLKDFCNDDNFNIAGTLVSDIAEQQELIPSLKINPNLSWRIFSICHFNNLKMKLFEELIDREKYTQKEYLKIKHVFNFEARFIVSSTFNIHEIKSILQQVIKDISKTDKDHWSYVMRKQSNLCINIQKVLNRCLSDQFGFFYDKEKLIIFKQTNPAYCFLALSYFGKPQHLDKIYSYILHNALFLKNPKKSGVRGTLINNFDVFFSIGKTSTYGLNSWNINHQFATKSIKEECIVILEKHKNPLHISQIYSSLKRRRKDILYRSMHTILEMESELFDNLQGFYWLVNSKSVFNKPINHKTAYSYMKKITKKFRLDVFWCHSHIFYKELKCPNYQIEYLIECYLISFKGKVTLKTDPDFLPLLTQIDTNQKIVCFLKTRYMLLDSNRRIKFKKKLIKVLQKDLKQVVPLSVLNKIIQFYI